jgi:hypothetical protein
VLNVIESKPMEALRTEFFTHRFHKHHSFNYTSC